MTIDAQAIKTCLREYFWLSDKGNPFGVETNNESVNSNASYLLEQRDWRVNQAQQVSKLIGAAYPGQINFLEAGCGIGISTIVANMGGLSWYGYDVDKGSIDQAMRLADLCGISGNKIDGIFSHADTDSRIPFLNGYFHVCVSHVVIEHVNSIYNYLAEVYRVLMPGGVFILCGPDYRFSFEPHYNIPWIPLLRRDLALDWVCEFEKPVEGIELFSYTTYPEVLGIIQAIGFTTLRGFVQGVDPEGRMLRERNIILCGKEPYSIEARDIPELAASAKMNASNFSTECFFIFCQKPPHPSV